MGTQQSKTVVHYRSGLLQKDRWELCLRVGVTTIINLVGTTHEPCRLSWSTPLARPATRLLPGHLLAVFECISLTERAHTLY